MTVPSCPPPSERERRIDPFYVELYRECHEHLRETDKKRDQLVAFVALIVGLLFGAFDKLSNVPPLGDLRPVVTLAVALIGVLSAVALVNYRRWHNGYVNSAVVLQHLMLNDLPYNRATITSAWSLTVHEWAWWRYVSPFGIEMVVFNIFLVFSFIPWHLVIELKGGFHHVSSIGTAFILNLLGYGLIMNTYAVLRLKRRDSAPEWKMWIFRSAPAGPNVGSFESR